MTPQIKSLLAKIHISLQMSDPGLRREAGQGITEYALILFFVAAVAISALTLLGGQISSVVSEVANAV